MILPFGMVGILLEEVEEVWGCLRLMCRARMILCSRLKDKDLLPHGHSKVYILQKCHVAVYFVHVVNVGTVEGDQGREG